MDQAPDQLLRVYEGDRLLPFRQLNPPAVLPGLRHAQGKRLGNAFDREPICADLVPGMLEDVHPIARWSTACIPPHCFFDDSRIVPKSLEMRRLVNAATVFCDVSVSQVRPKRYA